MSTIKLLYPNEFPLSHNVILLLPADAHFSIMFFISGADKNCGFLNCIIELVLAAAETRSVCRARKAGICTISQISLTGVA